MKLPTLLITSVIAAITASAPAQTISDRERDGLKGPVQTVRVKKTTTVDENGEITQSPLLMTHIVTYDRAGSRTEVAFYDKNGLLARRIVNTYEAGKKAGSITYDSNNTIVRRTVDSYGKGGLEKRTIEDFNEDGSLYKKIVLALNSFGDVIEFAEYDADGVLIKSKEMASNEGERQVLVTGQAPRLEESDRLVSFGSSANEYFEHDAHGNWTRGIPNFTFRKYESGRKIKTTETVYREITYYEN